jgi:hypothetical protein
VTWQDQLRELDQELAAGQISADEYRRRRDELLAKAQHEQDQAQREPAPAESGEGQPQGQQGPFPPPFKWEASTPDTTQVMQPVQNQGQGQDPSADTTQVVRGEPSQRVEPTSGPTQVVNPGGQQDPERTQVVRGPGTGPFPQQQFPPQQFPGQPGFPGGPQFPGQQQGYPGQPMPQQGGWPQQQQQEDVAPPWASSDFPPLDGGGNWVKQGPEVFDDGGGSKTGKIVGVAAAVVLLLGVAFGAYWVWGRGPSGGAQAASSAPAPTTTSKPKEPTDIADVGGTKDDHSDIRTFADIQAKIPYLTADEQQLYTVAGASKVQLLVTHLKDGSSVVILTAQASDKQAAQTAAQSLGQLQVTYGMQQVSGMPDGVVTTQVAGNGQPPKLRAHYASQGVIIRVEVTATNASGPGLDTVTKDFKDVLNKQLQLSPANT